jgi:hypothetical protein
MLFTRGARGTSGEYAVTDRRNRKPRLRDFRYREILELRPSLVSRRWWLTSTSVVLHCSRHLCWMIKKALKRTKVAKFASGKAQTAVRLDTSRGFVTKYEVNSRHLSRAINSAVNSEALH